MMQLRRYITYLFLFVYFFDANVYKDACATHVDMYVDISYMHKISSSPLLGNFWESAKVKAASRLECVAAAAVRGAASGWVEPRGCAHGCLWKKAH